MRSPRDLLHALALDWFDGSLSAHVAAAELVSALAHLGRQRLSAPGVMRAVRAAMRCRADPRDDGQLPELVRALRVQAKVPIGDLDAYAALATRLAKDKRFKALTIVGRIAAALSPSRAEGSGRLVRLPAGDVIALPCGRDHAQWFVETVELPDEEQVAARVLEYAPQVLPAVRALAGSARQRAVALWLDDRFPRTWSDAAQAAPPVPHPPRPAPPPVPPPRVIAPTRPGAPARLVAPTLPAPPPPRPPPVRREGWPGHPALGAGLPRAEEPYYRCDDGVGGSVLMAYIPKGTFVRGSEEYDGEKPVQRVTLTKDFYVGVYPVTVDEYARFVAKGKHGAKHAVEKPSFAQTGIHPVVHVSWDDAMAYGAAMGFRLLTEAEWEYVARGGLDDPQNAKYPKGRRYPWGDEEPDDMRLWWRGGTREPGGTGPVTECTAGVSPFGVHHLSGNVWEWVADWYGSYPNESALADPPGVSSGELRVLRGGSWFLSHPFSVRAADRDCYVPTLRDVGIGFRVARGVM